jgi:hypothetical protein
MVLHNVLLNVFNHVNITTLFNHLVLDAVELPIMSNRLSKLTGGLVILGLELLLLVGEKPNKDFTIDRIFLHFVDLFSHFCVLQTLLLSSLGLCFLDLVDLIISLFHGILCITNRALEVSKLLRFDVGVLLLSLEVVGFLREIKLGE